MIFIIVFSTQLIYELSLFFLIITFINNLLRMMEDSKTSIFSINAPSFNDDYYYYLA